MVVLLSTTALVAIAMLALGLGVLLGRRALRGSCGGACTCRGADAAGACPRRGDASEQP